MNLGTLLTLMLGLAAMAALEAAAWWLWTKDPSWPWTEAPSRSAPEPAAPPPASGGGAEARPVHEASPETERLEAPTTVYTKAARPEQTEILSDSLALFPRDENAPLPREDQMQTQPVRQTKARPPQPPEF